MCDWEIVDLFVTNDTQEANEKKEEDWQGAVWSVEVHDIAEQNNGRITTVSVNSGGTDASRTAGTYTSVSGTTSSGTGQGALFNITVTAGGSIIANNITIVNPGILYTTSSTITIAASTFGSTTNLVLGVGNVTDASPLNKTAAFVANWQTSWVMTCDKTLPMKGLEVGDTVRIGTSEAGHTNHRVVLEKRKIDVIYSGINNTGGAETQFAHGNLQMITGTKAEIDNPSAASGTTDSHFTFTQLVRPTGSATGPYVVSARESGSAFGNYHGPDVVTTPKDFGYEADHTSDGVTGGLDVSADPIYAYRINARVNATDPPVQFNFRHLSTLANTHTQSKQLLDKRHLLQLNTDWAYQDQKGDKNELQVYYGSGTDGTTTPASGYGGVTTTLTSTITQSSSILSVSSTTGFDVGDEILIESEQMKITAIGAGTLTVSRPSTTPGTHGNNSTIYLLASTPDTTQFVLGGVTGFTANKNMKIGSELMSIVAVNDPIVTVKRAQFGSIAVVHSLGSTATPFNNTKVTLTTDGFMLRRKQLPQPLFRTRRYTDSPSKSLQVDLDTGMKAMKWLKLMAYSMYGKQRVGVADTHEYGHQDWVAMSIDQINGKIISNNPYAQNAFYVLHGGTATEDEMGTIEIHERSDTALVTHEFQPEQALKQLNFRFTNREGEPSKFNRIHLWFKACVKRS